MSSSRAIQFEEYKTIPAGSWVLCRGSHDQLCIGVVPVPGDNGSIICRCHLKSHVALFSENARFNQNKRNNDDDMEIRIFTDKYKLCYTFFENKQFSLRLVSMGFREEDKKLQVTKKTKRKHPPIVSSLPQSHTSKLLAYIRRHWILYAMLIPGVVLYFLFCYKPMVGLLMAFENYHFKKGIFGSQWIGLANFERFFNYKHCWRLIKNTLLLNVYNMLWTTPINIIFALMINEFSQKSRFRKCITTVSYLPHFISGVVVVSIFNMFLMPSGVINQIITKLGGTNVNFLTEPGLFRTIYNFMCIWQETGWGAVIYVAALSGIDPTLYEAARMDGASKLQQVFHISLPCIASTIAIQFMVNLGSLLSGGTERVMLLYNEATYPTADIIGTYIYRVGLLDANYGYSTAVGLFQSLIGLILVLISNKVSKKLTEASLI